MFENEVFFLLFLPFVKGTSTLIGLYYILQICLKFFAALKEPWAS